ncbi:hypothetical protein [Pseudomonas sp. GV071]|uniref:hypothetical protein n=1 Tax=Pseudomonas sp. GV071 TaxID=2135754 RepID=UPI000D351CC7|nr:hypothetical protein [Pseudomonas sp. GV071]PTQ70646.1 hypothetical protein C8K61_106374 [Pseudomonas sp. GV071]
MRAIYATALLSLLTVNAAHADPQTVGALQAAHVPLSINQVRSLSAATGQSLAIALGKLAKRSPENAATIASISVAIHPELASVLVSALVTAAPQQLNEILAAAIAVTPEQAAELATLASDLQPTAAGAASLSVDSSGTGVPSTGNAGSASNLNSASPS